MNIDHRTIFPIGVGKALSVFLIAAACIGCGTDSSLAKTSAEDSLNQAPPIEPQVASPDAAIAFLHLVEARVNEPAPGQRMSAGYFTLMNHGTEAITLTNIVSSSADVQMHATTLETTGTTMRPLTEITIAPDSQIVFQPGGNHLMISNLPADAKSLPVTMTFDNGGSLNASFAVIPLNAWMNTAK